MPSKNHWDEVYSTKSADTVSWYQAHADQSLRLIQESGLPLSASIIDVGGGASTLVEDLLAHGYTDLSVLDLSQAALSSVQERLGAAAEQVRWIAGDITRVSLPAHAYDLWHDRAVFHFLTDPAQRQAYVNAVLRAVKPGGHVIVATFAEDGPLQCSGLPVMRYRAEELHAEFGAPFALLRHEREEHQTPSGTTQKFIYCYCRKEAS
jgi:ubiquinone/menaquinone biosynthesis C-methylase UbiE